MTQKGRVLTMLKAAGDKGIRSDEFFKCGMPRGAARVQDLKDEGHEITSEREGRFTRYRLIRANEIQGGRDRQVRGAGSGEDRQGAPARKLGGPSDNPRRKTQPARLFELAPERPLSAFTDAEAA